MAKTEQRLASRTNYCCPQEIRAKFNLEEQRKKQMGKTILITSVAFDSNKSCRQSSNGFCFSCIVAVKCTSVDSKRLSVYQTFWKRAVCHFFFRKIISQLHSTNYIFSEICPPKNFFEREFWKSLFFPNLISGTKLNIKLSFLLVKPLKRCNSIKTEKE